MRKIKLNPFTVALIVLVVLVIFSAVRRYFRSVNSRVKELENQINNDLKLLKLTRQRQEELAQKAVFVYRIVISVLFLIFITLISLTVFTGMSYIDALEVNLGTGGIIVTAITTFFYHTWNPDILLKVLKDKIKEWVYRQNRFDPSVIELLNDRVRITQIQKERLNAQII